MPHIQINNKSIHYLEINQEAPETIVMVHGLFTNLSVFYFKIAPLLSKDFHIVLYDLPSHGMSGWVEEGYSLKEMSDDLFAMMDALHLSKVHLVGYSFGGLIALYAAMHQPQRIKTLSILDSPAIDESWNNYEQEYMDQQLDEYVDSTQLRPNRRQIEKIKKLYNHLFSNPSIRDELMRDSHFMESDALNKLSVPVLLLYASDSPCFKTGLFLNEHIPGVVLETINGDHNLPVQNPEWISEKLAGFISGSTIRKDKTTNN